MCCMYCLQEVVQLLPKNAYYLALLAKQWTDCTYLDMGPVEEQLSDAQRREFNTTAAKYAKQVTSSTASGVHVFSMRLWI